MDKEREIKRIWRDTFHDDPQWIDRYFAVHYSDDSSILLCADDGTPISSLLLPRYEMLFHGTPMGMGYVSGAATRRRYRGQGFMSMALRDALALARRRGDALVTLIPAQQWLFYYYEMRGFARMLFTAEERFVACHRFQPTGAYCETDAAPFHADFVRLNARRDAVVAHTEADFAAIVADLAMDGGRAIAVVREGEDKPAAFAFAAPNRSGDTLIVKDLLADDEDARQAALAFLKSHYPDLPFIIKAPATDTDDGQRRPMQPYAMARVVNPLPLLQAYAAAFPSQSMAFRVSDHILPENIGFYLLPGDGTAQKVDFAQDALPVDVNILGSILFSSRKIGEIFSIKSARPVMTLMMD